MIHPIVPAMTRCSSADDPLLKGAEQIDLAPDAGSVGVKYWVDMFPYKGLTLERSVGADAIGFLKWTANLNIEDRRKPQSGTIKSNFEGQKREIKIQTAGTTAGEYARLFIDPKKRHDFTIDTIGFTDAQKKLLKESVAENTGVVLLSVPKGQGLTSLSYAVLKCTTRSFSSFKPSSDFRKRIWKGSRRTSSRLMQRPPKKQSRWIGSSARSRKFYWWTRLKTPRPRQRSWRQASRGNAFTSACAGSTFEALDQWRRLVGDNRLATESLKMVISGRVLRKLCMACKVGYAPDASTLKKLNMNPEKVSQLFQGRSQPLRDPKGRPLACEFCHDLRFKGRTGVFEFLMVDEDIREAIEAARPLNQPFRKQRGRYLQEEALALVEKGDTSVQEVLRVLKGGGGGGGGEGAEGEGGRPPARRQPSVSAT